MIEKILVLANAPEFDKPSIRVYRYLDEKEQAGDHVIPLPHINMEIRLNAQKNESR